jgi:3-dehydroquinate synthetase
MPTPATVRVEASRGYDVQIGPGLLSSLGQSIRRLVPNAARAVLVYDSALPVSLVRDARTSLAHAAFSVEQALLQADESLKSLDALTPLLSTLASHKLERTEPVIALGGGIIGDLAGFAAAIYRRGVPVVQCPTTLLSMVDASVGGKTGANLLLPGGDLKKNLVGAFHQPHAVLADTDTLRSLPARELRGGLAECLKHGMLSAAFNDPDLFSWTLAALPRILALHSETLVELIARNVAVKARVVAGDEREEAPSAQGGRALLNLGHTFGHAIETLPTLSPDNDPAHAPLTHGEAVSLGLHAAAACAVELGIATGECPKRVKNALSAAGLPAAVRGLPSSDHILQLMAHDKKVAAGRLRLVLPKGDGTCVVVDDPPRQAVLRAIEAIRLD